MLRWQNCNDSISIHALRKECDGVYLIWNEWFRDISIHALRKECDCSSEKEIMDEPTNFYPRTP